MKVLDPRPIPPSAPLHQSQATPTQRSRISNFIKRQVTTEVINQVI